MVFLGLNYVLGRHILGHREHESIEHVSNKGNAVFYLFIFLFFIAYEHI